MRRISWTDQRVNAGVPAFASVVFFGRRCGSDRSRCPAERRRHNLRPGV